MRTCLKMFFSIIVLLVLLAGSVIGCSNDKSESGKVVLDKSHSAKLVNALSQAETEEDTREALEEVLTNSLSLGLLDEDGKQLNPYVSSDAVSLSTFSVSSYTQMGLNGSYRTIEYTVDFLADGGIQLESTSKTITVKDFLPELQAYVNRSFDRPDDPESTLGIMIASGPDMIVPDSPPTLTGDSAVSPFVSLLIAADVILGIDNGNNEQSADNSGGLFTKKAVAATNEEAIQQIRGLITTVKNYSILTDLLPQRAQQLLAAFEVCDRLSVRMWEIPNTMQSVTKWDHMVTKTLAIARSFILEKGKKESVAILGGVAVMNGVSSVPETIEGVDTSYRFQLVSSNEQGSGTPLFTDADAVLSAYPVTGGCTYSPDLNGHRLRVSCKSNVPFVLSMKSIQNETPRRGILHASALISAPENLYEMAVQKLKDKLGDNAIVSGLATLALDQLPWDEIKQTMVLLNRDFQPTPWMCTVDFTPVEKESTEQAGIDLSVFTACSIELQNINTTMQLPDGTKDTAKTSPTESNTGSCWGEGSFSGNVFTADWQDRSCGSSCTASGRISITVDPSSMDITAFTLTNDTNDKFQPDWIIFMESEPGITMETDTKAFERTGKLTYRINGKKVTDHINADTFVYRWNPGGDKWRECTEIAGVDETVLTITFASE